MSKKRIIEEQATTDIFNDDWLVKDSVTQGTTKIQPSVFKAWINDGMATEEDIETIVENIADTYSTSESYAEGDLCIHEYALFKCIGATTGTWDSTKWEATTIAEIISTIDLSAEAISYDNTSSGLEAENVQEAIDETITKLSAVGSASGAIATFTDGSALPMPSLKVAIEPQQDLHGYDAPWVGGAGKNKLPMTVEGIKAVNTYHSWSGNSTTINNVTITIETDVNNNVTGIKFNGTASADITFNLASNITISNGSYIWSNDQTVNISNLWLSLTSPNIAITLSTQKEVNVTVSNDSIGSAYIYASSGNVFNNIVFKPMIRLASVSDATFAPYSNICPISGWDEVNVSVCGKNVWNNIPFLENKYISDNNGTISNSNNYNIYKIKNNKNISYKTLSFDFDSSITNQALRVSLYDVNGVVSTFGQIIDINERNNCVINADDSIDYFLVSVRKEASDIQLENGNQPTTYEPYNGSTYTIDLDGTRYGGEVDLVSGVMTVTHEIADLPSLGWGKSTNTANIYFYVLYTSGANGTYNEPATNVISNIYTPKSRNSLTNTQGTVGISAEANALYIADGRFDNYTVTQFKEAMSDVQLLLPLATPLTIQLTPTQVKSLLGQNNVWADTGDIQKAEYVRDATTIINEILSRLNA